MTTSPPGFRRSVSIFRSASSSRFCDDQAAGPPSATISADQAAITQAQQQIDTLNLQISGAGAEASVTDQQNQLKLNQAPAVADTRKTEHLTWSIYDLTSQGQPVDLALAEQDGTTYIVLLATPSKADHQTLYDRTSQMALSPRTTAFNLDLEPQRTRDLYGRSAFGQGCLMARRLIEAGVTFVEVQSPGARSASREHA